MVFYLTRNRIFALACLLFATILCIALIACTSSDPAPTQDQTLFEYLPSSQTGIHFTNQINETVNRNIGMYDYFYNGAGVACGDFDNDGLTDIFFTGNDAPNRIYKNNGELQFEDQSGTTFSNKQTWSTGVTLVDINQDGLLDIYVCNSGPTSDPKLTQNQLFINQGNFQFSEEASQYGIADDSRSSQAVFFDMDNDGDLDLWVLNHSLRSHGRTLADWYNGRAKLTLADHRRECNTLYENRNNQFVDISKEAGIEQPGFGLGISLVDFNEDGLMDVFVANDYFIPDFLYINNGNNTFSDHIKDYFNHTSYYSMGADAADINNDGSPDLAVVDMTPSDHVRNKTLMTSMNTTRFQTLTQRMKFIPQYMFNGLYLNHGKGYMSDIAHFANVASTDWSWAPLIADFDNDGFKDLFVTTGFYRDTRDNDWLNALKKIQQEKGQHYSKQDYFNQLQQTQQVPITNKLFQNTNGLRFTDATDESGIKNKSFSNGAAYADFDNDGDLDIVVNNLMQEAYLIENKSTQHHNYIQFELPHQVASSSTLNTNICIYANQTKQCVDYQFTRGYLSHMQALAHFGLGSTTTIDSVVFTQQQDQSFVLIAPEINKKHHIKSLPFNVQQDLDMQSVPIADVSTILLPDQPRHIENPFNEFEKEILLPHAQTRIGPAIAVADVNGDGLEDVYFGGAAKQSSQLYIQHENGSLHQSEQSFDQHAIFEDNAARFLDIDNDGDQDLYVASGTDNTNSTDALQDRLYLNNGNGQFTYEPDRLPVINHSTKAIVPLDWDQDGDLDLFIGGRHTPGRYPESPHSYFLENQNGYYTDKSIELAEGILALGMITDAIAVNVDTDDNKEIMLVGEWMPITILDYEDGIFKRVKKEQFKNTVGWWQSLSAFDYDNDGDEDILAGNIGLNNKFHPTPDKPLHVYAHDFDQTGNLDIVLGKSYKNKLVPVRGKECSTEQMPFISDKFKSYDAFANASLIDILGEDELNKSIHFEATMFESILLINTNSDFEVVALPDEAQLFPILDANFQDINEDGKTDIILAGNVFGTEVETTPYDAGRGVLLINKFPSALTPKVNSSETGLNLAANVKSLTPIQITRQAIPGILVGNNNGSLQLLIISNESL